MSFVTYATLIASAFEIAGIILTGAGIILLTPSMETHWGAVCLFLGLYILFWDVPDGRRVYRSTRQYREFLETPAPEPPPPSQEESCQ